MATTTQNLLYVVSAKDGVSGKIAKINSRLKSTGSAIASGFGRGGIATVAIAAFGAAILKATNYADDLAKAGRRIGLSTQSLQAYGLAVQDAGGTQRGFTKGVENLSKNLGLAAQGIATYSDAFKNLGVEIKDGNGIIKSNEVILRELAGAFKEHGFTAENTADANAIFGRSWRDLLPLLVQGEEGLDSATARAKELGIVLSQDLLNGAELATSALGDASAVLKASLTKTLAAASPLVLTLSDAFIEISKSTNNSTSEFSYWASDVIKDIQLVSAFLDAQEWQQNLVDGITAARVQFAKFDLFLAEGLNDIVNSFVGAASKIPISFSIALKKASLVFLQSYEFIQEKANELLGFFGVSPPVDTSETIASVKAYQAEIAALEKEQSTAITPDFELFDIDGLKARIVTLQEETRELFKEGFAAANEEEERQHQVRLDATTRRGEQLALLKKLSAARSSLNELSIARASAAAEDKIGKGKLKRYSDYATKGLSIAKKVFGENKVIAKLQAFQAQALAAIESFKVGAAIGGPIVGAGFAAASIAATNGFLSSVASSSPVNAAGAVTIPDTTPADRRPEVPANQISLSIVGDSFSPEALKNLFQELQDALNGNNGQALV